MIQSTRYVVIDCDAASVLCSAEYDWHNFESLAAAAAQAAADGWTVWRRAGRWRSLCPDHGAEAPLAIRPVHESLPPGFPKSPE